MWGSAGRFFSPVVWEVKKSKVRLKAILSGHSVKRAGKHIRSRWWVIKVTQSPCRKYWRVIGLENDWVTWEGWYQTQRWGVILICQGWGKEFLKRTVRFVLLSMLCLLKRTDSPQQVCNFSEHTLAHHTSTRRIPFTMPPCLTPTFVSLSPLS